MVELAARTLPVGERFFLLAILLYAFLALALGARLLQMFAGPLPQADPGRVAAGWPATGAR